MDYKKGFKIIVFLSCALVVHTNLNAISNTATSTTRVTASVINPTTSPFSAGAFSGGGNPNALQSIVVSGMGYPGSIVTILIDGTISGVAIVDTFGSYIYRTPYQKSGKVIIQAHETSSSGDVSPTVTTIANIVKYSETKVSNLNMAPSMFVNQSSVMVGDTVTIEGYGVPFSTLTIISTTETGDQSQSDITLDKNGYYSYNIQTSVSNVPELDIYSRYFSSSTAEYLYTAETKVAVGIERSLAVRPLQSYKKICDISIDGRVNIIDFSILSFFYRFPLNAPKTVDLTGDGIINLDDISQLAYCWTG